MADQKPTRIRRTAKVIRAEARMKAAARRALVALQALIREQLDASGMDPDSLTVTPTWTTALEVEVLPVVDEVYVAAMREAARDGSVDATAYAVRHIESVWNRLVGVADTVFDNMRTELRDGLLEGETIPELAARVEKFLTGEHYWKGRAEVIARTEVIAANNSGHWQGAGYHAEVLGVERGAVIKEWLPTFDGRTRPTHAAMADEGNRYAVGMDTTFRVGSSDMEYPGDPAGAAQEVIRCRCTVLYHYPGDDDYPAVTAAASTTGGTMTTDEHAAMHAAADSTDDPDPTDDQPANTSTVVVALPAEDDPIRGIGPEDKHSTLLWFGEVDDATADAIRAAVESVVANQATEGLHPPSSPFPVQTAGVELLGDDEPQAVVVKLNDGDGDLEDFRVWLLEDQAIREAYEAQKQWPRFTPHVTLGYGDEVTEGDRAAAEALAEVRFDRLAVWQGDRQDEYELPGAPADAADQQEEAVTAAAPEVVSTEADTAATLTWEGPLVAEGLDTGDGRHIDAGAIQWMGTPGVLFAMWDGGSGFGGHEDQVPVGLIATVERRQDGRLWATGTWADDEDGQKARRMNIDGRLRGVSVDLDDVEFEIRRADGTVVEGDALWDLGPDDEVTMVITKARLRGATLWAIPAFVEAYVLDSTVADQAPDTSLVAAGLPLKKLDLPAGYGITAAGLTRTSGPTELRGAPAAAFVYPGLDQLHDADGNPRGFTMTDDGRVFGYAATWGTCHIGIDGACVTPPESTTDYAHFQTRDYVTAEGEHLAVGAITLGTGHAPLELRARPAAEHYDHTGTVAAFIRMGEDEVGIWFAGAMNEDLPLPSRRELARAGGVSGDWRAIGANLEAVALLAVNVPGFPIPKVQSRVAGGQQQALVASGIVRPSAVSHEAIDYGRLAREVTAYQARQHRRDQLAARLRATRRAKLIDRLATTTTRS